MEEIARKSTTWEEGELLEGTSDPSISMIAEDVPTLTVAAILGVTVVVLIAIAAVFILGILIDCRQQRILSKKIRDVKRLKIHKRANAHPEGDIVSIAHHMEEPELSVPPATVLQQIP
ncbi:uncharacterized protein [Epargyreus clarus]|uniref:uncharacterized protein n=1 Tax=Epargyreus clarus TaxID=520877 RepID=UPI003C2EF70C